MFKDLNLNKKLEDEELKLVEDKNDRKRIRNRFLVPFHRGVMN